MKILFFSFALASIVLGFWTCDGISADNLFFNHGQQCINLNESQSIPAMCDADDPNIDNALIRLGQIATKFRILNLPRSGNITVPLSATLTIEDLRDVVLDANPPVLGQVPQYTGNDTDGVPPEARAFIAHKINPFQFRYFSNEFNVTGRGVAELSDYAAMHGFSLIANRPSGGTRHRPSGSSLMHWLPSGGGVPTEVRNAVKSGRYDLLCDLADGKELSALYLADPASRASFQRMSDVVQLMVDVEDPILNPEQLRQQSWYPRDAGKDKCIDFEAKYYRGFQLLHISPLVAARSAGYPVVSLYGWQPIPRTWYGLDRLSLPSIAIDWAWSAYGRNIYQATDLVHNDVYCFYYDARNIAYVLANIDINREFIQSLSRDDRKPIRPYIWLRLHGGGGDSYNWWECQQLYNEEVRAMSAMMFFSGVDGFVSWDWIAQPRYAGIPDPAEDTELMVGRDFSCRADDGRGFHRFNRYDVLHVVSYDPTAGLTRFQRVVRNAAGFGVVAPGQSAERFDGARGKSLRTPIWRGIGDSRFPYYTMRRDELRKYLRPWSENVGAMIEGMALVRPIEYLLRHGRVEIDVPARVQFSRSLPIVRRIKIGRYHVIITYDPNVIYRRLIGEDGVAQGSVVLADFSGCSGLTVQLPADDQVRIAVLRDF